MKTDIEFFGSPTFDVTTNSIITLTTKTFRQMTIIIMPLSITLLSKKEESDTRLSIKIIMCITNLVIMVGVVLLDVMAPCVSPILATGSRIL